MDMKFWLILPFVAHSAFAEPTGCPDFAVEKPRQSAGPVLRAADFGLSSASDKNATAINRALAEAKRQKASRVELAPGTYRCFDEPGVVIDGFVDFTLDGKGAVLVFRRPPEYRGQPQSEVLLEKGNILVKGCLRTWVKNVTMDWDWQTDPLADFMVVRERHIDRERPEESYIEFELPDWTRHPKYPEPVPLQKLTKMDLCRTRFVPGPHFSFGQKEGHFGAKNDWVSPNRLRVWPGIPMPGRNQNPATGYFRPNPAGNLRGVEKVAVGELYRGLHCYYGKNGLNLLANRHLTVSDVTVWSAFGMALVIDGPQEYWQVERFRVVPPTAEEFARAYPGVAYRPRPMTSSSDGHHVARSKGHARYIDCEWRLNNDDANNFHDRFTIAVKCGERRLQIINKRGQAYFRAAPGTPIELRRPNFDAIGFTSMLVKVEGDILVLDRAVPEQKGPCFLVWDRGYGTDNILFKGCKMVDSGYRNLFNSSNVTIEDCLFVRNGNCPIRILADYQANLWCEGLGATNIVVRGCRFEDPVSIFPESPVISTVCVTPPGWEVPPPDKGFVGGGLLIEDCTFIRPRGPVLDLRTGRDVIFRNSRIDLSGVDAARWPKAGMLLTDGAENVTVENVTRAPAAGVDAKSEIFPN